MNSMKPRLMSCGIFSLVLCILLFQASPTKPVEKSYDTAVVSGNSYYVSTSGINSGEGSLEQPFRTVQKGCDAIKPGDTLYIKAGEYNEKIVIKSSGTEAEHIAIQPFVSDKVVLNGEGIGGNGAVIYIEDKSYIRIKGLEIKNSSKGDTPSGIFAEGSGRGIEIIDNKIHSIQSEEDAHGIAVYGTNGSIPMRDITISGNEVWDCRLGSSESVVVNGNVEDFVISKNIIHNNDNIGIDCIGFEGTAGSNDQARSGLVSENTVYNISSASNPAYEGDACADGIYVDGGKNIIIEKNTVYSCDIGVEVAAEHHGKSATGVLVRNNLIYYCGLYGLAFGGSSVSNGYAEDCTFQCNTIYGNDVGICIQKSRNNGINGNIVFSEGTLIEGSMGSNVFSHNLWYSPDGNPEGLSAFEDPQFMAPGQSDFRLKMDSPAIDAGNPQYTAVEGETDLSGNKRVVNGRVDCGALEFAGQ